jgi:hypothetical protein
MANGVRTVARSWYITIPVTSQQIARAIPDAFVGVAITLFIAAHGGLGYGLYYAGGLLLCAAVLWSNQAGARRYWVPLALFTSLVIIGCLGSVSWGMGYPYQSIIAVGWAVLCLILYMVRTTPNVWLWLMPGLFLHAALVAYQGLIDPTIRAVGLAQNPNVAGGLLAIGIVYLIASKRWLWALPLFAALPFPGARLAVCVVFAILPIMVLFRVTTWHAAMVSLAVFLAAMALTPTVGTDRIVATVRAPSPVVATTSEVLDEAVMRLMPAPTRGTLVGILPQGYAGDIGLHSAPLRLLVELGIIGLGGWVWLSCSALWKRRQTATWWTMLTMSGLSTLDYYTIMLPLSALWVLGVSLQVKELDYGR